MLTRKVQNFSKLEKIEGTVDGTIADSDGFLSFEPTFRELADEIDLDPATATLSKEATLLGLEPVEVGYRVLFRGAADVLTVPEFDAALRRAGFKRTQLNYLTAASVGAAGTFLHGETITGGTSGATATVVRDAVAAEDGKLFYEGIASGPFEEGETVTGAKSAAAIVIGTHLEMDATVSGTFQDGETINFSPSSAAGVVLGTVAAVDGNYLAYSVSSGTPTDADTVTGATSSASCDIGASLDDVPGAPGGYKYQPTSDLGTKAVLDVAWDSNIPTKGDVIKKEGTNDIFGVVISATNTEVIYEPQLGSAFADNDVVEVMTANASPSALGSKATIDGAPAQELMPSTTEQFRQDGMSREAVGCRGNVTVQANSGQPVFMQSTNNGVFGSRTTKALGSPTVTTEDATLFRNAKVRIRDLSASPILDRKFQTDQFTFASNNTISPEKDPEAPKGAGSMRIRAKDPAITIDPAMVVPAIHDYYGDFKDRTLRALYCEMAASGSRRPLTIYAPKVQFRTVEDGDRDGTQIVNITGRPTKNADAGDDDIFIYQT